MRLISTSNTLCLALIFAANWAAVLPVSAQGQISRSDIDASVVVFKEGDAYFKANDYERALERFKRSNEFAPSSAAYIMQGISLIKLKRYAESIPPLQQTIRMVPTNPEAHYWLGMTYKDTKQYENAEIELREAIRLKPAYQIAYTWLGSVCYLQKKHSEAIAAFQPQFKPQGGGK